MKTESELADLISNNSMSVYSLCRLCLTDSIQNFTSLFEIQGKITLSQKIMLCTRLHISPNDSLPSNLCVECLKELELADSFRLKCEFSDLLLRKVYKIEDNLKRNNLEKHFVNCPVKPLKEENFESIKEEPVDISSPLNDAGENGLETEFEFNENDKSTSKRKESNNEWSKNDTTTELEKLNTEIHNGNETNVSQESAGDDLKNESNEEKDGKWICKHCRKSLNTKNSLKYHIESMHSIEKLQKYGKVTGQGKERKFHCSECDYTCPRRQHLIYHMTTHTGDRLFECDICNRSFARHNALNNHKKTHSNTMNYTCPECGKQFKYRDTFTRHKKVHSNLRPFVCTVCNKGLKTQSTLNDHMNRHNNIKNYRCEKCGMAVVSRSELTNHLRNHGLGGDKFQCNICEYSTYQKKTLDIHIRRHTGDRSFKCELCEFSCYTKDELRFHMRKHTKEQNYSCPICEMKFRHSPSVNKHMLNVHGKKYKWNDCVDRRFVK